MGGKQVGNEDNGIDDGVECVPIGYRERPRDPEVPGQAVGCEGIDRRMEGIDDRPGKKAFIVEAVNYAERKQAQQAKLFAKGDLANDENRETVSERDEEEKQTGPEEYRGRSGVGEQLREKRGEDKQGNDGLPVLFHGGGILGPMSPMSPGRRQGRPSWAKWEGGFSPGVP